MSAYHIERFMGTPAENEKFNERHVVEAAFLGRKIGPAVRKGLKGDLSETVSLNRMVDLTGN